MIEIILKSCIKVDYPMRKALDRIMRNCEDVKSKI
jgi:hypothetical protein